MRDDNDRRFATAMQTTWWQAHLAQTKKKEDKKKETSKWIVNEKKWDAEIDKRDG